MVPSGPSRGAPDGPVAIRCAGNVRSVRRKARMVSATEADEASVAGLPRAVRRARWEATPSGIITWPPHPRTPDTPPVSEWELPSARWLQPSPHHTAARRRLAASGRLLWLHANIEGV